MWYWYKSIKYWCPQLTFVLLDILLHIIKLTTSKCCLMSVARATDAIGLLCLPIWASGCEQTRTWSAIHEGRYIQQDQFGWFCGKNKRKIHSLTDNDCCLRLKLNSKFSKLKLIRQCGGVVSQCRTWNLAIQSSSPALTTSWTCSR